MKASPRWSLTTGGPFAETKEQLAGYYLLETSTADEAVAIAARIPAARRGSMEVRPILIFSRPRMSIFVISHVVQVDGAYTAPNREPEGATNGSTSFPRHV